MSHAPHPQLGPADRRLLCLAARFVPPAERADWVRSWTAELWHSHNRACRPQADASSKELSAGLFRDALWLRCESWKQALRGTPLLCLLTLSGLCLLAGALGIALHGTLSTFCAAMNQQCSKLLIAGPLVLLVTSTLAPTIPIGGEGHQKVLPWIRRKMFLTSKIILLLLLAFVLSEDLCHPFSLLLPVTAEYLQVLFFVILALLALRWAFLDQGQRCTHCVALLAPPARVGRPSHILLEWNGTELACRKGHGLLSIPELETSWRSSSEWIHGAASRLVG